MSTTIAGRKCRTRLERERGAKALGDVDSLEVRISGEISGTFGKTEEEVSALIDKLANREWAGDKEMNSLMERAHEILPSEPKAEIQHSGSGKGFASSYKLKITSVKKEINLRPITADDEVVESIVSLLQEHFNRIQESKASVQDELVEICAKRRKEIEGIGQRINSELEGPFTQEDARIQEVVKVVKENIDSKDPEEVEALTRKARLTLLRNQRYTLEEADLYENCGLRVVKEASLKAIDFEERKARSLIPSFREWELLLSFVFFDEDEVVVLKEVGSPFEVEMKMWEKGHEEGTSRTLTKELTLGSDEPICFRSTFTASTTYCLKTRIVHQEMNTQWSDEAEFIIPEFEECCVWKECPDNVDEERKYSVDEENPRTATKVGGGYVYCTIIGNTPLPRNKVTSWSIKVLKSRDDDGCDIYVGVAPSDIDQNEDDNFNKCGWYFNCFDSTLWSGPPHKYRFKEYGPRNKKGEYVHTGDSVGVVMDTAKGEFSFALNGVNLGVAFDGIPLDKPLVPCAILCLTGDSAELVI